MQRIMIIGGPGAGKTHLAQIIGARLDLPVIAIDHFIWCADGSERPPSEIDAAARAATEGERWIIEGGNTRTYSERVARADTLIRLCPPRWLRILRTSRRPSASLALIRWTWRYDAVFGLKDRDVVAMARSRPIATFELARRSETERFLALLPGGP